ncbi:MAG: VOC family protein [Urechidicola sp.]|nr:VOC family protein [Urechidicola sp.]
MKNIFSLIVFVLLSVNTFSQVFEFSNNHFALLVKDIDKSAKFYSEILQLEEIKTPKGMPDTVRWFVLSDKTQIHLTESDEKIKIPKGLNFSLSTNQLVEFINLLITKKVSFEDRFGEETKTTNRSDGVKLIYLQDPDGYWIEINNDVE